MDYFKLEPICRELDRIFATLQGLDIAMSEGSSVVGNTAFALPVYALENQLQALWDVFNTELAAERKEKNAT